MKVVYMDWADVPYGSALKSCCAEGHATREEAVAHFEAQFTPSVGSTIWNDRPNESEAIAQ